MLGSLGNEVPANAADRGGRHDVSMGEELDLVAKTIGESIGPLAEASGTLGPVKELADWVTSFIHYRRMPALAKQANAAAEKIRKAGLPPTAVPDKLLKDILEGGSMEDDESLQERWANLLANAMTAGSAEVRAAFPQILKALDSADASILNETIMRSAVEPRGPLQLFGSQDFVALDNLERLGLVTYQGIAGPRDLWEVTATPLGQAFVEACRPPHPPG